MKSIVYLASAVALALTGTAAGGQGMSPRVAAIKMLVDSQKVYYRPEGMVLVKDDTLPWDILVGTLAAPRSLESDASEMLRMLGHGATAATSAETMRCQPIPANTRTLSNGHVEPIAAHMDCVAIGIIPVLHVGAPRTDKDGITRVLIEEVSRGPLADNGLTQRAGISAIVQVKGSDLAGWRAVKLELFGLIN